MKYIFCRKKTHWNFIYVSVLVIILWNLIGSKKGPELEYGYENVNKHLYAETEILNNCVNYKMKRK